MTMPEIVITQILANRSVAGFDLTWPASTSSQVTFIIIAHLGTESPFKLTSMEKTGGYRSKSPGELSGTSINGTIQVYKNVCNTYCKGKAWKPHKHDNVSKKY